MRSIIISRTDNIGDVMLTLPLAGFFKNFYGKEIKIFFIGKSYTKALIEACENIDEFLERDNVIKNPTVLKETGSEVIIHAFPDKEIAKAASTAGIRKRIGTSHRLFHWWYCNKLVHFTRKSSDLHEAQLNFKLLKPLKINTIPDLKNLPSYYGFKRIKSLPENLASLTDNSKFNIIFHPKSKGSAREWPLEKYYELAKILGDHYKIFVTGTENEGQKIRDEKPDFFLLPNIIDLTGKLNLDELVSFIAKCDGLLACSTGPLHISAALGKHTCGIYPPMKPIHPGRWAPLGKKANVAVLPINCKACRKTEKCLCIESIGTLQISELIKTWRQEKK